MPILKKMMEIKFGDMETYRPEKTVASGEVLGNGLSAVQGRSYAEMIRDALPEFSVHLVGFFTEHNPESLYAKWNEEGADFAIVEDRYLVDPFPKLVLGKDLPVVYDLNDPEEAKKVAEIYGDRSLWEWETIADSLSLAKKALDAIINNPVTQQFRENAELPGWEDRCLQQYGKVLSLHHPSLSPHFKIYYEEMEKVANGVGVKPNSIRLDSLQGMIAFVPTFLGKDELFEALRKAMCKACPTC